MASIIRATSYALVAAFGVILAGCANDGSGGGLFGATTTASIPEKPKVDPVCVSLTSQIDTLKKEGVAEKIEKAAVKKYKMTQADLTKAAQLNKANAEFQTRCATTTTAQLSPAAGPATSTTSSQAAAISASQPIVSSVGQ